MVNSCLLFIELHFVTYAKSKSELSSNFSINKNTKYIPVDTRRRFNVYKTSIDVADVVCLTTSCVYWDLEFDI